MNPLIRNIVYAITRKHIDERKLSIINIKLNKEDISYFNLSTNSITSFMYEGKLCYFRECPKILSLKDFFDDAINKFFVSLNNFGISKEHFSQDIPIKIDFNDNIVFKFKEYLDTLKEDSNFFKKLSKADLVSEKSNFSIWSNQIYDYAFFEKFGFYDVAEEYFDILVYFLWNMRSAASTYRILKIAKGKRYSYFSAARSISSRIVAEELGLENMITDAKWCVIETNDGKSMFGVLSNSASGKRMADITPEPAPTLQRELNLLNVLDVICFQTDHGPNNYNVDDKFHICAFDNDNPTTFLPIPSIFMSFSGCSPIADKKGIMMRPYFDKLLADKLNTFDREKLKKRLKPYLNSLQLFALFSRIDKLKKSVNKACQADNRFLLDCDEWNSDTVNKELSGKYGVTYFTKAIKEDNVDF